VKLRIVQVGKGREKGVNMNEALPYGF
jgi:hypothetical protein